MNNQTARQSLLRPWTAPTWQVGFLVIGCLLIGAGFGAASLDARAHSLAILLLGILAVTIPSVVAGSKKKKASAIVPSNPPIDNDAVSPVIGVILMVAITVVLAAVVFVFVNHLSNIQSQTGEQASVSVTSPVSGQLYIALVQAGTNGPYSPSDLGVSVDNHACTIAVGPPAAGAANFQDGSGKYSVGDNLVIQDNCASPPVALASGSQHILVVKIHGSLIVDNISENVR